MSGYQGFNGIDDPNAEAESRRAIEKEPSFKWPVFAKLCIAVFLLLAVATATLISALPLLFVLACIFRNSWVIFGNSMFGWLQVCLRCLVLLGAAFASVGVPCLCLSVRSIHAGFFRRPGAVLELSGGMVKESTLRKAFVFLRTTYLLVAACAFALGNAVLFGAHDPLMLSLGNPWADLACFALFFVVYVVGGFLLFVMPPALCGLCLGPMGEDAVKTVVLSHEEAIGQLV